MKRKILKELKEFCTEIRQSNSHYVCKLKNGGMTTISFSKGDEKNVWNNIRRDFKREGIKLPLK